MRFLLLAILSVLLFIPSVSFAQDISQCNNPDLSGTGDDGPKVYCPTADAARAGLTAFLNKNDKNDPKGTPKYETCGQYKCYTSTWFNYVSVRYAVRYILPCPVGKIENRITGACMEPCSSRQPITTSSTSTFGSFVPNGSVGCNAGCVYMHYNNGDGTATGSFLGDSHDSDHCALIPSNCSDYGTGYYLNYSSGMCEPPRTECKANQVRDPKTGVCQDVCPAGMHQQADGSCKPDDNTCPAGQVKAPDGSCIDKSCPAGQVKGSDGSCKRNNDPNKDNGDDDKYFSGGDDCSSPPSCSGDPILCGQSRIQWRIDCNTRKNINVSGGSCGSMPVCTGEKCDALEYTQLIMQWRTACALEKKPASGSGDDNTDDSQPNWTKVTGMSQDPGQGSNADDTKIVSTNTIGPDKVDSSGWLGSAGCPPIMGGGGVGNGVAAQFANALASPPSYFCDFIGAIASITVLGAAVWCAVALAKG